MRKNKNMIAAVMLSVAVLALVLRAPIGAAAAGQRIQDMAVEPPSGEVTYSLSGISSRQVGTYAARAVYYNSVALGNISRVINGTPYVAIRAFVEGIGAARVSYSAAARTITLSGNGHNVSVSDGAYALYANGRVFFSSTPSVILSDGRMYVPAAVLARALSLTVEPWSGGSVRLVGTARAVVSGAKYYADDAVYWLSRIISAESRGEALIGQIAVGNVVLNRVRSSEFPSTIYGVIFDRKYGVQFSPVSNGTIYREPSATSILAAKICLDGFTVSDDVMYFLRPSASTSSWIVKTRPYIFSIGNHYFFA
jgi:N-acetylmuramoyl-L-alanine amidase